MGRRPTDVRPGAGLVGRALGKMRYEVGNAVNDSGSWIRENSGLASMSTKSLSNEHDNEPDTAHHPPDPRAGGAGALVDLDGSARNGRGPLSIPISPDTN